LKESGQNLRKEGKERDVERNVEGDGLLLYGRLSLFGLRR